MRADFNDGGQWLKLIVIPSKRSLRGEEPVPSEAEGIWASRARSLP
jgi:hypothetical protein